MSMRAVFRFSVLTAAVLGAATADEVSDWNRILLDALIAPPAVAAPLAQRPAAIVQAAVFGAVNDIERRYTPLHVTAVAPPGASQRAAAVQAAYAKPAAAVTGAGGKATLPDVRGAEPGECAPALDIVSASCSIPSIPALV